MNRVIYQQLALEISDAFSSFNAQGWTSVLILLEMMISLVAINLGITSLWQIE